MSLKEEIDKLVKGEKAKLENRDRKHSGFRNRKRERFSALRSVLDELKESVDHRFLRATIDQDSAHIEIGRDDEGYFSRDIRWRIEPNSSVRFEADKSDSLFQEEPGFRVDECRYYRYPTSETIENSQVFDDESAVAQYLVECIAEKVAEYERSDVRLAEWKKDGEG